MIYLQEFILTHPSEKFGSLGVTMSALGCVNNKATSASLPVQNCRLDQVLHFHQIFG